MELVKADFTFNHWRIYIYFLRWKGKKEMHLNECVPACPWEVRPGGNSLNKSSYRKLLSCFWYLVSLQIFKNFKICVYERKVVFYQQRAANRNQKVLLTHFPCRP